MEALVSFAAIAAYYAVFLSQFVQFVFAQSAQSVTQKITGHVGRFPQDVVVDQSSTTVDQVVIETYAILARYAFYFRGKTKIKKWEIGGVVGALLTLVLFGGRLALGHPTGQHRTITGYQRTDLVLLGRLEHETFIGVVIDVPL